MPRYPKRKVDKDALHNEVVAYRKVVRPNRTLVRQQTKEPGAWQAATTDTGIALTGPGRGVEHEFRVVASNIPGDTLPCNLMTVVL